MQKDVDAIVKYADPRVLFISKEVQKYTVAIAPLNTAYGQGSGTCVLIGGRFFVATAAHVISGYPEQQYAILTPSSSRGMTPRIIKGGRRGGRDGEPLDIGWLELPPQATSEMDRSFLPLARMAPHYDGAGEALRVCGAPIEHAVRSTRDGEMRYSASLRDWPTCALSDEHVGFKIDAEKRIYAYWPAYIDAHNGDTEDFPEAAGISGGGLWSTNLNEHGDGWRADQAQLIGVEFATGRSNARRYVICQKIHLWLQMLAEDVPELAPEISNHLNGSRLLLSLSKVKAGAESSQ